ncbi:2-C-methyl-D-erythritol 4-phosphate cytidylyltransferase [Dyadobacter jejuensis]|nr:2-C-methyl-D-erythritol 4-phosphate cytidylyltransferase [Dyadobacter jejuensis]
MKEFAIIVAGGSGSRMKSDLPKQFIEVNGLPILMHTLRAFRAYSPSLQIIVVLPASQMLYWKSLCLSHGFIIEHSLVEGGDTRFHSVQNGLNSITDTAGLVTVHDGVRPVIDPQIIALGFREALSQGSAVTSVPLKDSIRHVDPDGNQALDRTAFRLVQTPQTFHLERMRHAFTMGYQPQFTDCASVLEQAGFTIHLIEGSYQNIKITTPEDLEWAKVYLNP